MFRHILLPLDGSRLAESALPAAVGLSQSLHASVTLLHVIEKGAPEEIHGEKHLVREQEALEYLQMIAVTYFSGSDVKTHVHTQEVDHVGMSIIEHSAEFDYDLIIMCSHGHGGLRKAITGSIAQYIIGRGKIPVLLIQPGEGGKTAAQISKVLVALDSKPEHESGLALTLDLAKALGASVHLVHVIPDLTKLAEIRAEAGRVLPAAAQVMMEMNEAGGREYLIAKSAVLVDAGITTSYEIRHGDTARQIIQAADAYQADVIVLATHGKAGIQAFWSGSVAPKVANLTHSPLLLAPVVTPPQS